MKHEIEEDNQKEKKSTEKKYPLCLLACFRRPLTLSSRNIKRLESEQVLRRI
jgi:hypothetical protein